MKRLNYILILITLFCNKSYNQYYKNVPLLKYEKNKLIYIPDSLGNMIPDYSFCGYRNGDLKFPVPEIKAFVKWSDGDMTTTIQSAIDYVSSLPLKNGLRGTIVIDTGIFKVNGQLKISSSGVVLKGRTINNKTTKILATGYDRRILFKIKGNNFKIDSWEEIENTYIPIGSIKIITRNANKFKSGDQIYIRSTVTKNIINTLRTDWFGGETEWIGWKENERDLYFLRKIIKISYDTIFIDVPLTISLNFLDSKTYIARVVSDERIYNVGIENLILESEFDSSNIKDENHSWTAISFDNSYDCWIKNVIFKHFAGSAVYLQRNAQRTTVMNCISLEPISEIGGWRRRTFFNEGEQNLFIKCYSENGYNDFACGFTARGPNAFVFCESYRSFNFSGCIDSWSSGVLFDNVEIDGHALVIGNIGQENMGAGWCAVNSVLWNCSASKIICDMPSFMYNWAYGTWGQFEGRGIWVNTNSYVNPNSLYFHQLYERTGKSLKIIEDIFDDKYSTSSPSIDLAFKLTKDAYNCKKTIKDLVLKEFINDSFKIDYQNIQIFENKNLIKNQQFIGTSKKYIIKNGWFTVDGRIVTGKIHQIQWWRGNTRWYSKEKSTPHLTRFVPAKEELGFTDDVEEVVQWLKDNNYSALSHHYGLWYERRRDDHERVRRIDGNVWAPFYEQPFDRSGIDYAWDGLSKYDLKKYNKWYWLRLKQFADKAESQGIFLFNHHYFQHNILEAGAHWVDFPWRTANNVNNTEFPELPNFAGGKRIFMAEQFYDTTNQIRKQLHQLYIFKNLDNFKQNNNVIHFLSEEYTGPYSFMKFWLDQIKKWEKINGMNCLIAISCTKDVQDSVLNDKNLIDLIDIIEIKYWYYTKDGNIYSPPGGANLAPRQFERILKPGAVDFYSIYKSVYEYKKLYPEKVVIYNAKGSNEYPWAIFMAGGSFASIPLIKNPYFLASASSMKPIDCSEKGYLLLENNKGERIIYFIKKIDFEIEPLINNKKFDILSIDPTNGDVNKDYKINKYNQKIFLIPNRENTVIWLYKKKK